MFKRLILLTILLGVVQSGMFDGLFKKKPSAMPEDEFIQKVQDAMDAYALKYNTSLQYSVRRGEFFHDWSAGIQDHANNLTMTNDNIVPMGSGSKPYTAVSIMKLVEDGKMHLNDSISQHVDEFLMKTNHSTLLDIWKGDETINKVTIYQLLHMTSGLRDYDDRGLRNFTFTHPDIDLAPIDYLYFFDKTFHHPPGEYNQYSSVGYGILGLALAQHAGVDRWEDYDWLTPFPEEIRGFYNQTIFATRGKCSSYKDKGVVVKQWTSDLHWNWPAFEQVFYTINEVSCLNTWAAGHIMANSNNAARFFWDFLGADKIVNRTTIEMMANPNGWQLDHVIWVQYGLGLILDAEGGFVGHGGMDWGSQSPQMSYNYKYNFSNSMLIAGTSGKNCSLEGNDYIDNVSGYQQDQCEIVKYAIEYFSNRTQINRCSHFRARPSDTTFGFSEPATLPAEMDRPLICQPFCGVCRTGECKDCQKCIGKEKDLKECAYCYAKKKGHFDEKQACLYNNGDGTGCERCWSVPPDSWAAQYANYQSQLLNLSIAPWFNPMKYTLVQVGGYPVTLLPNPMATPPQLLRMGIYPTGGYSIPSPMFLV